jgi:hypothetical protein
MAFTAHQTTSATLATKPNFSKPQRTKKKSNIKYQKLKIKNVESARRMVDDFLNFAFYILIFDFSSVNYEQ